MFCNIYTPKALIHTDIQEQYSVQRSWSIVRCHGRYPMYSAPGTLSGVMPGSICTALLEHCRVSCRVSCALRCWDGLRRLCMTLVLMSCHVASWRPCGRVNRNVPYGARLTPLSGAFSSIFCTTVFSKTLQCCCSFNL